MRRLFSFSLLLLSLAAPLAHAVATPDGMPYSLENTVVHNLHASALHRDYQIFVSLPKGYSANGPALPVVFLADADYSFPVVRGIAYRVGGHSDAIGSFILVGLSYAVGDTPEYSRRRDYTPTETRETGMKSDMPGRTPVFGEAEGYRQFLASDVLPFVQKHYRVDMAKSVFIGHSYGSLLGTHILLASPGMFNKYVLSSPSLWFNQRVMFDREKKYSATHSDLNAHVFFAVGGFEAIKKGDPRYNTDDDMVRDLREFNAALNSHHYPNLHTSLKVYEGHDHLTVYPDMVTDALKWATPGKR